MLQSSKKRKELASKGKLKAKPSASVVEVSTTSMVLPTARVKRIAMLDKDTISMSSDAVALLNKSGEMFTKWLAEQCYWVVHRNRRKVIHSSDMDVAFNTAEQLRFLRCKFSLSICLATCVVSLVYLKLYLSLILLLLYCFCLSVCLWYWLLTRPRRSFVFPLVDTFYASPDEDEDEEGEEEEDDEEGEEEEEDDADADKEEGGEADEDE